MTDKKYDKNLPWIMNKRDENGKASLIRWSLVKIYLKGFRENSLKVFTYSSINLYRIWSD